MKAQLEGPDTRPERQPLAEAIRASRLPIRAPRWPHDHVPAFREPTTEAQREALRLGKAMAE